MVNLLERATRLFFVSAALAAVIGGSSFANAAEDYCPKPPNGHNCPPPGEPLRKQCIEQHPYHCEGFAPKYVPPGEDLIYEFAGQTYRLSREGVSAEIAEACPDDRPYRIGISCREDPEESITENEPLDYIYKGQKYRLRREIAKPH